MWTLEFCAKWCFLCQTACRGSEKPALTHENIFSCVRHELKRTGTTISWTLSSSQVRIVRNLQTAWLLHREVRAVRRKAWASRAVARLHDQSVFPRNRDLRKRCRTLPGILRKGRFCLTDANSQTCFSCCKDVFGRRSRWSSVVDAVVDSRGFATRNVSIKF